MNSGLLPDAPLNCIQLSTSTYTFHPAHHVLLWLSFPTVILIALWPNGTHCGRRKYQNNLITVTKVCCNVRCFWGTKCRHTNFTRKRIRSKRQPIRKRDLNSTPQTMHARRVEMCLETVLPEHKGARSTLQHLLENWCASDPWEMASSSSYSVLSR